VSKKPASPRRGCVDHRVYLDPLTSARTLVELEGGLDALKIRVLGMDFSEGSGDIVVVVEAAKKNTDSAELVIRQFLEDGPPDLFSEADEKAAGGEEKEEQAPPGLVACPDCQGTGGPKDDPCPTCEGKGEVSA